RQHTTSKRDWSSDVCSSDLIQYLYASGDTHAFMDMNTYDQLELQTSQIEEELNYIVENMTVDVVMFQGEVIGIDLPKNVELEVRSEERRVGNEMNVRRSRYE